MDLFLFQIFEVSISNIFMSQAKNFQIVTLLNEPSGELFGINITIKREN